MFDVQKVRKNFPIFARHINGKPLVYLDSTATSLKPQSVIDAMDGYYREYSANVFRGIYKISEKATAEFEKAREKVGTFIHAPSAEEIIFTRNASESINLVAYSWGRTALSAGDEIVVTIMEHHSNFVPWQQLTLENGVVMRIWNCNTNGELCVADLDSIITRRTKLLAITAVSNVLGTINPIKDIIRAVKRLNSKSLVLVDAAQAVPHARVDVQDWGADFVVFSSHKMLGPTGVGVLWGKRELLESMPPFLYGGEMIREVRIDKTIFKPIPYKFEAGTPDIAGVIGLGAAVDYLADLDMDSVRKHETEITEYACKRLASLKGLMIYGPKEAKKRGGVIAFTLKDAHAHDVAQILDSDNVCIRAGNHCAMPLHLYFDIRATARASFYIYTKKDDIDALMGGLEKVQEMFS